MVSDKADVCPKCGASVAQAPVETQPQQEAVSNNPSKPKQKGVVIACVVAVLLLIGGGAAWYFHDDEKTLTTGDNRSDYGEPVYSEELRRKAEAGDASAQTDLGICYAYGYGVARNINETVKWFQKAADKGYGPAAHNLALCYIDGQGVSQNCTEAVRLFRIAAAKGYTDSQIELGCCLYVGKGCQQDYEEAFKLFKSAAEKGDGRAMYNLGICYGNGNGVERNQEEADRMYRLSAESGFQPAIDFLNQRGASNVSSPRQKEKETVNFTGTYEFNDGFHTWVLVLNADESATIQEKEHQNDPDMTSYGSWNYNEYFHPDFAELTFRDIEAKVWFKSANNFVSLSHPVVNIQEWYLYMDESAAKAKNPNLRIKLTKTK